MYDWIQKELDGIPLPEHATVGGWKIWLLSDGSLRVWGGKNTEIDVDGNHYSGIILKESDRDNFERYVKEYRSGNQEG